MTEVPWPLYVGVVVASAASVAKVVIDFLTYRRNAPLDKAREELTHSEVEVNLATAAGLMEDVYTKRDERQRARASQRDVRSEVAHFQQRIHIGDTAPEDPQEGDLWIDTSS